MVDVRQQKCGPTNLSFRRSIYSNVLEIIEKECVKERYTNIDSENSNCVALHSHLTNS